MGWKDTSAKSIISSFVPDFRNTPKTLVLTSANTGFKMVKLSSIKLLIYIFLEAHISESETYSRASRKKRLENTHVATFTGTFS